MSGSPEFPGAHGAGVLTIALIGPDEARRMAVATALAECHNAFVYPHGSDAQGEPFSHEETNGHADRPELPFLDEPSEFPDHNAQSSLDENPESGLSFERTFLDEMTGPAVPSKRSSANGVQGHSPANALAITEFSSYPHNLEGPAHILDQHHDAIIVDLDSDPERALDVVRSLSDEGSTTVMVYSEHTDREMVVRSMRAGAREFLSLPISSAEMASALARIPIRRPSAHESERAIGGLFVFLGTKGGCGVTTIASNFAVSLALEGQKTLLVDLGLPLGDAAINLGMSAEYSTDNAFHNASRMDSNFLLSLLAKHSSGLSVLAAPGDFPPTQPSPGAIDKLLAIARQIFDYVVVDVGSRLDLKESGLFDSSAIIYLITQVGVSELRNANRIITRFFAKRDAELQIILNRYTPRALLFNEEHITRALTRQAQWRIPDDFATARRTRNTATPLALEDSPISTAIREMARKACGLPEYQEKKRGFHLFGRAR